jgi:chemotaxis protein MotB
MPQLPEDSIRQLPIRKSTKPLRTIGKAKESGGTSNEIWLLTLSDLLMLLLIFFVLLFALPFFQRSIQSAPKPAAKTEPPVIPAVVQHAVPQTPVDMSSRNEKAASLAKDLAAVIVAENGRQEVTVERRFQNVVLIFPERIVFDSGKSDLKGSVRPILSKVAAFIAGHPGLLVEIQGHTDDRPIHNRRYASNWELSADRATQVAKALVAMGVTPEAVSTRGFAEYRPVRDNDSDEDRLKNRRVEIQFSLPPSS